MHFYTSKSEYTYLQVESAKTAQVTRDIKADWHTSKEITGKYREKIPSEIIGMLQKYIHTTQHAKTIMKQ